MQSMKITEFLLEKKGSEDNLRYSEEYGQVILIV